MPSGKTHEKVNFWFLYLLFFLIINTYSFTQWGWNGFSISLLFCTGYWFGTYFLNPDLDLKSRPYYRWRKLRFIWIPYQKTFSHRSFWTHGILIGDVIRILYVLILLFVPYSIFLALGSLKSQDINQHFIQFFFTYIEQFTGLFVGVTLASLVHIVADHSVSYAKKKRKKKKTLR